MEDRARHRDVAVPLGVAAVDTERMVGFLWESEAVPAVRLGLLDLERNVV